MVKQEVQTRAIIMDEITKTMESQLVNLYNRWCDEKEHEDFKDYEKVMSTTCSKFVNCTFIEGTKKPFGLIIKIENFPYDVQIFVNSNSYGWKSTEKRLQKGTKEKYYLLGG